MGLSYSAGDLNPHGQEISTISMSLLRVCQVQGLTATRVNAADLGLAGVLREVDEDVELLLLPLDRRQRVGQVVVRNWKQTNIDFHRPS